MVENINEKNEEIQEQKAENTGDTPMSSEDSATNSREEGSSIREEICFSPEEIERLMTAIKEKNCLLEEINDRYKRLQADFDNFRRRSRSEKEELANVVTEGVVLNLLPVIDNFERALASGAHQDAAKILTGVEMIYRQFTSILEKMGVTPIQSIGEPFDPSKHEAVMRVDDPDKAQGTIVEELQKGYTARGRVVRPSMVKVVG